MEALRMAGNSWSIDLRLVSIQSGLPAKVSSILRILPANASVASFTIWFPVFTAVNNSAS
jgi:hypothetical protein